PMLTCTPGRDVVRWRVNRPLANSPNAGDHSGVRQVPYRWHQEDGDGRHDRQGGGGGRGRGGAEGGGQGAGQGVAEGGEGQGDQAVVRRDAGHHRGWHVGLEGDRVVDLEDLHEEAGGQGQGGDEPD